MHENVNNDFELISEITANFSGNSKLILVENQDVVIVDLLKEVILS